MVNFRDQRGSSFIIVIVLVIAVGILGALGWVFWSNYATSQTSEDTSHERIMRTDPNEGYLVLEDWGVRFKIPDGLSNIKYYKDADTDSYDFTTQRVEDLGQKCSSSTAESSFGATYLGGINRSTEPRPATPYTPPLALNDNKDIDGYYYSYTAAQGVCSTVDPNGYQGEDRALLSDMVRTIQSSE